MEQYIRPSFVTQALFYLKNHHTHYANIPINQEWIAHSKSQSSELWTSLTVTQDDSENTPACSQSPQEESVAKESDQGIDDSEDEVDLDNPVEVITELRNKRSINCETCIYPEQGPSVNTNEILSLAPGEGHTPTSVFHEKDREPLAFPTLFPFANNTFHSERQTKIGSKRYISVRLLSKDTRFAESTEYTFQCLHWVESTSIHDTISMSLKKNRQSDLSV